MYSTIIFDLSEVLISGLTGIEKELSKQLGAPEGKILDSLYTPLIFELFRGEITEKYFLEKLINTNHWNTLSVIELRALIRNNFKNKVVGMETLVEKFEKKFDLALLSDHAKEWIDFIKTAHPYLRKFKYQFFSFDIGHTKQEAITFSIILNQMGKTSNECIFIDDLIANIETAQSVGIKGIVFENSIKLIRELNQLGIYWD
jgi:putative hydrolase of the HAD superfamily